MSWAASAVWRLLTATMATGARLSNGGQVVNDVQSMVAVTAVGMFQPQTVALESGYLLRPVA